MEKKKTKKQSLVSMNEIVKQVRVKISALGTIPESRQIYIN